MRSIAAAIACTAIAAGCAAHAQRAPAPPDGFIQSGDVRLSYHVDRPDGAGPFPAVVIGHGSGEVTKDQLRRFADVWVARGYVVLRYDKRGVGESTGVYSGVGVQNGDRMFDELSSDMAACVEFLERQPGVDPRRTGLMGASQAGWIIPLAAKKANVAFMILMSGPAVSIGEEMYYSDFAETGGASLERAYDELSRFHGPRGFDPVPTLESLNTPGLWLLGQADESIPEKNTAAILRALAAKGRPFTVVEYPGANHGLFTISTGQRADFWADIDRWLARTLR
jgi:dienelactone hydrolase